MLKIQPLGKITILLLLLIVPLLLIIVIHSFAPGNYVTSSLYKIIFLTPLLYRPLFNGTNLKQSFLEHISLKTFRENAGKALLVGLGLSFIYGLHYLLFKNLIAADSIVEQLGKTASITAINIILIGLFIIVINSFLEEFFWRGFAFHELQQLMAPWKAHLITGIAFSLHHIIFYYSWFSFEIVMLVTIGLILYAIFMNLFFKRFHDLLSCWIIHAMVDIVQILIALSIFKII